MISSRVIDEVGYPIFYYVIEDLYNKSSLFSLYKLQSLGENIDQLALTEAERDAFNIIVKKASSEVFKKLSYLSQGIVNAEQFKGADIDGSGITESECIVYIYSKPLYWDDNLTGGFDQKIEDALITYVLKEWFKLKSISELYLVEENNYQDHIKEILRFVNFRTQAPKLKSRSF